MSTTFSATEEEFVLLVADAVSCVLLPPLPLMDDTTLLRLQLQLQLFLETQSDAEQQIFQPISSH